MNFFKKLVLPVFVLGFTIGYAQDSTEVYKKRVLENTEVDFLSSYYSQDGANAAVSGGFGSEELTDATGTVVVSIPLNDDDILTIDAGISAYTSASSSNIDPFDGNKLRSFYSEFWCLFFRSLGKCYWSV